MATVIRPAVSGDFRLIIELIYELAEYDRLGHAVRFENAAMREYLFGPRPMAEVLIAEVDDEPEGFALFYYNFSTFEGRPGLYLEDLFVRPQARGQGLGKALLVKLAELAVERRCSRLQWSVLDWNASAIAFYEKLGARPVDGWTVMRMDGPALAAIGKAP